MFDARRSCFAHGLERVRRWRLGKDHGLVRPDPAELRRDLGGTSWHHPSCAFQSGCSAVTYHGLEWSAPSKRKSDLPNGYSMLGWSGSCFSGDCLKLIASLLFRYSGMRGKQNRAETV